MNHQLKELLSKFEDGEERYRTEAVFNHCIKSILNGTDPLNVLDSTLKMIKLNSDLLAKSYLERQNVIQVQFDDIDLYGNRSLESHQHTKGKWKIDKESFDHVVCDGKVIGLFHKHKDAELCTIAPELYQIAQMYFDTMKTRGEESSLPYQLTLRTLKRLDNEQ